MKREEKKSLNHTEFSVEIHLTLLRRNTHGVKKGQVTSLAIPLSQQNDSSDFTKILLKTPSQTKKINEVQLYKGERKI